MAQPRRFPDRDYSAPGWYFVTCVCADRAELLGELRANGRVILSPIGDLASTSWSSIATIRPWIVVDQFVIMPNHLHGLLQVCVAPPGGAVDLHVVLSGFKGAVTRWARRNQALPRSTALWQRSYDVRVLANTDVLARVRRYIADNPRNALVRSGNPAAAAHRAADYLRPVIGTAATADSAADCSRPVSGAAAAAHRAADWKSRR